MKNELSISDELIEAIMSLGLDELCKLYDAIGFVCNDAGIEAMERVDATYRLERDAVWEKRGPDDLRAALSHANGD